YRGLRQPDRYPIAVLEVRLDPSLVDVNVHPTKREVRFRNECAVFAMVERACFHALRASPLYRVQAAGEGLRLREPGAAGTGRAATGPALLDLPVQPVDGHWARPIEAPDAVRPELPSLAYLAQSRAAYLVAE